MSDYTAPDAPLLTPEMVAGLRALQTLVHTMAVEKGWHEWKQQPDGAPDASKMLINLHGEVSEAWEEYRKGKGLNESYYLYHDHINEYPEEMVYAPGEVHPVQSAGMPKPEGIPIELADVLVRLLDTCAAFDIDLPLALERKIRFNATRPYRHGGKKA